jgi:hypothetical protein
MSMTIVLVVELVVIILAAFIFGLLIGGLLAC